MKKRSVIFILVAAVMCLLFVITGCNDGKGGGGGDDRTWRVTFDSRGGNAVESQTVRDGDLATRPQAPKNNGFVLVGWYKDEEAAEEWNFDTDKVKGDMTLYASWREETASSRPENISEIYLTFGNETVTATLYDNATSRDLVTRLPLTLSFSDYNNTEKIAYLPSDSVALDTSDAPDSHTPTVGDLTVYIPWGNIAIFYRTFRASSGLAPFGKLDADSVDKLSRIGDGMTVTITSENPSAPETPSDEPKVLVVYFSATGTTERVAKTIQSSLDADIYEIKPAVPYTSADLNYNTDCRANREQNDPSARPEISGSIENIGQYEVIFIGYPIWWGKAPKIIYTFFESCDSDFEGVTIIPFCTSGSSGIGSSATDLHGLAPSADWKSGARIGGTDGV